MSDSEALGPVKATEMRLPRNMSNHASNSAKIVMACEMQSNWRHRSVQQRHIMLPRRPAAPPCHRSPVAATAGGGNGDLDPIERMFGKLFGRAALEDRTPAGMSRLSEARRSLLLLVRPLPPAAADTATA